MAGLGWSDHKKLLSDLKYIDIAKTSRQLFSIRSLVRELQLVVLFYSFFAILGGHFGRPGEGRRCGATSPSSRYLSDKYRTFAGKETTCPSGPSYWRTVSESNHSSIRGTKIITFSKIERSRKKSREAICLRRSKMLYRYVYFGAIYPVYSPKLISLRRSS